MASIKVKLRPSVVADREGTIYYQILHERTQRQIFSGYHVFPSEWNEKRSMVTASHKSDRQSLILSIRQRIRWDIERLTRIIRNLENSGMTYTADDIIDGFRSYADEYSMFNFMESQIIRLKRSGRIRTAETYAAALNSFRKFRDNEDIMLDCITTDIMEAYEAWLQQRGISQNTISFYTRIYLASLDTSAIDKANSLILSSL